MLKPPGPEALCGAGRGAQGARAQGLPSSFLAHCFLMLPGLVRSNGCVARMARPRVPQVMPAGDATSRGSERARPYRHPLPVRTGMPPTMSLNVPEDCAVLPFC